jgi:DNA invertase Pin-like site-specific DNA recombinase
LADVERDLIRTRTAEGRSRAQKRGQHMGRPPKPTPQQQKEARRRPAEGATLKELAQTYNVGLRRFQGCQSQRGSRTTIRLI